MSADFIARLVGMVLFAVLGVYWGVYIGNITDAQTELYAVILGLVGALIGLVLTPFITTRPVRSLRALLGRVSSQTLLSGLAGLMAGLIIAALLAYPISLLPFPFGDVLPFIGVLLFSYLVVAVRHAATRHFLWAALFAAGKKQRSEGRSQREQPHDLAGYERHHRRPHRRHRPDRVPGRDFAHSPLRAE